MSIFKERREFIKNAATLAGSSLILPGFNILSKTSFGPKQEGKLGVALVGLGNYSNTMLAPALLETEHCYLAGLVTGTPEKATSWSKKYNIPAENIYNYDNFNEIAKNDAIDIVYIVLPNNMHAPYTIRGLEAGKHVICEKPMALNAKEGREMIAAANKNNRKLAIGYRLHYDPWHKETMRLTDSKAFGEVNYLECSLGYSFVPESGSWKLKKSMGGGSLYNLGVYPIQGARYTKGVEPVFVTAQASTKRKNIFKEIDEIFTWQLEFADGTLCNSFSGPVAYLDRLYAGCTDGFIEIQPCYNYTGQYGRTSNGPMEFTHVFQQKLQMDDFALCVKEDRESRVKGEEGLLDMLVIDAIHKAIKSGNREKVEPLA